MTSLQQEALDEMIKCSAMLNAIDKTTYKKTENALKTMIQARDAKETGQFKDTIVKDSKLAPSFVISNIVDRILRPSVKSNSSIASNALGRNIDKSRITELNIKLQLFRIATNTLNILNKWMAYGMSGIVLIPENPRDVGCRNLNEYLQKVFKFYAGNRINDDVLTNPSLINKFAKLDTNETTTNTNLLTDFLMNTDLTEIGRIESVQNYGTILPDLKTALRAGIIAAINRFHEISRSQKNGYVGDTGTIRLLNKNGKPFSNSKEIQETIEEYKDWLASNQSATGKSVKNERETKLKLLPKLEQVFKQTKELEETIRNLNNSKADINNLIQHCNNKLKDTKKYPVGGKDYATLNTLIKNYKSKQWEIEANVTKLNKQLQELLNPKSVVFSMANIMKRIARINNFACTGKWRCPECGAEMKGDDCKSCGYSCK